MKNEEFVQTFYGFLPEPPIEITIPALMDRGELEHLLDKISEKIDYTKILIKDQNSEITQEDVNELGHEYSTVYDIVINTCMDRRDLEGVIRFGERALSELSRINNGSRWFPYPFTVCQIAQAYTKRGIVQKATELHKKVVDASKVLEELELYAPLVQSYCALGRIEDAIYNLVRGIKVNFEDIEELSAPFTRKELKHICATYPEVEAVLPQNILLEVTNGN